MNGLSVRRYDPADQMESSAGVERGSTAPFEPRAAARSGCPRSSVVAIECGSGNRYQRSDQTGETGGMQELLITMREELGRFALARRCRPEEVDDLMQDLYIKLSSANTGPVANPRAYLYQMANNLILDRKRAQIRQDKRDDAWARKEFGQDLQADPTPHPERIAIDKDMLVKVEGAIADMPPRTAQILRQFRLDGMNQKAIATQLGISVSAVEKHLQRAYRRLIELRAEFDGDAVSEDLS